MPSPVASVALSSDFSSSRTRQQRHRGRTWVSAKVSFDSSLRVAHTVGSVFTKLLKRILQGWFPLLPMLQQVVLLPVWPSLDVPSSRSLPRHPGPALGLGVKAFPGQSYSGPDITVLSQLASHLSPAHPPTHHPLSCSCILGYILGF